MGGRSEELKGSLKEAAGTVRDDDDQRREGQREQVEGKLKKAGDDLRDATGKAADAVRGR